MRTYIDLTNRQVLSGIRQETSWLDEGLGTFPGQGSGCGSRGPDCWRPHRGVLDVPVSVRSPNLRAPTGGVSEHRDRARSTRSSPEP